MKDQRAPFWRRIKLGDAVTLQRGKDLPVQERLPGPFPVIGSSGVVGYHSHFVAKGPGVLVGRSGSVGSVTWIEREYWPLNTSLWVSDFHGNDPRFIFYFLEFLDLGKFTTGVSVPTLNRNIVHPLGIELPLVLEQRAIVRALDSVQAAKEAQQHELSLERERKAALMEYLFTHGTRGEPSKQTEIGEIPESWQALALGQFCRSSAFGPRFGAEFYSDSGNVAVLRTTDLDDEGNVDYSSVPRAQLDLDRFRSHLLDADDFLITRSGTCGIASVFKGYEKPVLPGAFLIRFRLSPALNPEFLRNYINSIVGRNRVQNISAGAIQKNLTSTSLLRFRIPIPSMAEQDLVNRRVACCSQKIRAIEREAMLLDELFCAMLEELMTGRLSAVTLIEEHQAQ